MDTRLYTWWRLALLMCGCLALRVPAQDLPPVPSMSEAIKQYEVQQGKEVQGPRLSDLSKEDREVVDRFVDQLHQQLPEPGLKVGEKAPDFVLPNAYGKPVRLYDQLEKGPVILTFYRGAWCPYCNIQLLVLNSSLSHFARYGASVIAVTPQNPDKTLEQVTRNGYPFEILSDLDSAVIKKYRLYYELPPEMRSLYKDRFGLDLAEYNGEGRYELPATGTFVIDHDGVVRAVEATTDFTIRMEPERIIAALKELDGGRTVR